MHHVLRTLTAPSAGSIPGWLEVPRCRRVGSEVVCRVVGPNMVLHSCVPLAIGAVLPAYAPVLSTCLHCSCCKIHASHGSGKDRLKQEWLKRTQGMAGLEYPYKTESAALFDLPVSDAVRCGDVCISSLVITCRPNCISHGLDTEPVTFVVCVPIVQRYPNASLQKLSNDL